MTKVRRFYRNEEIDSWTFQNEKEAEEFINEKSEIIPEDYMDQLRFTEEVA